MLKQFRNHFTKTLLFTGTLALGITLTGCTPPNAQKEPLNGISVGALNKPVQASTVLVWANEAITSAYSYDSQNYQNNLQQASQYFTTEGWQAYMAALTASGNLNKVIKNKMVVSAVSTGAPVILSQGELAGRYSWKVQVPLLVTYQTANQMQQQHLVVTALIVRTSQQEGVRGLGIKQFIAIAQATDVAAKPLQTHAANNNNR